MKVTTTHNAAGASFVRVQSPSGSDLSVLMAAGETAEETLRRQADEHRRAASRSLARARICEAAADAALMTRGAAS